MHATAPTLAPPATRLRLGYLDGLRGLAALYVVVFHVSQLCHGYAETEDSRYRALRDWGPGLSSMVRSAVRAAHFVALGYGRFAVDVFIVLSGYVLMLPVVRANRDSVSGGLGTFMYRRGRRILPPYYAAMILTLLLGLLVPTMRHPDPVAKSYWDDCTPMFAMGPILSHVFMFQNWTPWALRIDGPMWSVAVEFQIYLLFPLALLPLRKWIGSIPTAVLIFAGGQLLCTLIKHKLAAILAACIFVSERLNLTALEHYLSSVKLDPARFDYMSAWFAGEFAIGMVAASIGFSGDRFESRLRDRLPWAAMATFFGAMLVFFELAGRKSWEHYTFLWPFRDTAWGSDWVTDLTVSLGIMCLIVHMTQQAVAGRPGPLMRILDQRWAVRLGEFSYSLYLVHFPVVNGLDLIFRRHFGPGLTCVLAFAVSLPAAVVLSYFFHLVFEKPFMSPLQKQAVPALEASTIPQAADNVALNR